jgi:UDP-N-acetylmuramate--alanine ligase
MALPQKIYMVGIGGIGMSALAQLLQTQGRKIRGSDRSESPTTDLLERHGISVEIGDPSGELDGNILDGTELLIYSDAVFPDHPVRREATEKLIPELSYFQALGDISKTMRTVAVAGTHGKTTTTGMLAKILEDAGVSPTAIVGSIVRDFESNFLAPSAEASEGQARLFVVEACEYKNHLLELDPEILVITNIELDHTDFFPDIDAVIETFRKAAHKVPKHGVIIADPSSPHVAQVLAGAQARIVDYTQMAIGSLKLPGEFNRMNGRAALAAAKAAFPSLSLEAGVHSLSQFQGSWRRFEYKGETKGGATVYDDYAHHPTAVDKTILAAKEMFPGKRIVVAFHPHLYSRTKSFLDEFAGALSTADFTIVAPIFAAREKEDPTVSHRLLAQRVREMKGEAAAADTFDEIRDILEKEGPNTIIITMGAGDIYKVAEQITQA